MSDNVTGTDASSTRVIPAEGPASSGGDADATQAIPTSTAAEAPGAPTAPPASPKRMPWRSGGTTTAPATEAPAPSGAAPSGPSASTDAPAGTTPPAGAAAASPRASAPKASTGPRKVRLALSRVDPWSVMKLSFLVSIAIGIAIVVAVAVVWNVLNSMQVFTQIDGLITDIAGTESFINILEYVEFSRVMSLAVVIGVVDIVIFTAMATLFAFLYNVVAALVGGVHVTLTDD